MGEPCIHDYKLPVLVQFSALICREVRVCKKCGREATKLIRVRP